MHSRVSDRPGSTRDVENRGRHRRIVGDEVSVTCLCEDTVVGVPTEAVWAGRTRSCGSYRCEWIARKHPEMVEVDS